MHIFKIILILLFIVALFSTTEAKMYKWVDENGKVSYTNLAPPSSAKKVESSGEVVENPTARAIRLENERIAREEEVALKQYKKQQRQFLKAEQKRRNIEASRIQHSTIKKQVGLTAAQQKMLDDMAKRKFTAPGFSGSAKKARIHTQEVRNQRAIDQLRAQFLGATLPNENSNRENSNRQLSSSSNIGQCMGDCGSEQGICIGYCSGDGQCISRCASAHGRCVSRCN